MRELVNPMGADIGFYQRQYAGSGIMLNGAEAVSKVQEPLGTIYFVPGLSGTWSDYTPLLVPLAKRFRICTYDQRGHASSPGKFDVRACADDLEQIIANGSRPAGIIGHSISCKIAVDVAKRYEKNGNPIQGVYMIEPFLGVDFLNWPQQAVVYAIRGLSPALHFVDDAFNEFKRLRELNGFNNRDFLASYGSMARLDSSECAGLKAPIGYMLADNDSTLGTNSKKHFNKCIKRLNELFFGDRIEFPWYESDSYAAKELNHCLNRTGFRPFLRNEKGKNKDVIIFAIQSFFYNIFEKQLNE